MDPQFYSSAMEVNMAVELGAKAWTSVKENWIILLGATVVVFIGIRLLPKRANVPVYSRHSGWRGPWKDSLEYLHDSAGTLRASYQKVISVLV